MQDRLVLSKSISARLKLQENVGDLERRGLLQYDPLSKRYDLHPVVRCAAAGGLRLEEKESYGQRVVDHFSQKERGRYDEVENLVDLQDSLHVFRALIQMDRHQIAYNIFRTVYRPGDAEYRYAVFRFYKGVLTNEHLERAKQLPEWRSFDRLVRQGRP